jgi:hypothetical protein
VVRTPAADDKSPALKVSDLARVLRIGTYGEQAGGGGARMLSEDAQDRVDSDGLPVGPTAEKEEQLLDTDITAEAEASDAPEVPDQFLVAVHPPVDRLHPRRA